MAAVSVGALIYLAHAPWVDFSVLMKHRSDRPSIVLDDEGVEWTRFQLDQREPVARAHMPEHLIQAFIATEDRHFYQHAGISWQGIARSVLQNIYYRRFAQGASTITQQLVRLLFFDTKKTVTRKLKEQFLALLVERQFSKDQIIETYLNNIYFGCGIYGVAAAAQRFWGKQLSEITPDEAAVLAGIVKSPARYCPLLNPDNAIRRRNVVLGCMERVGYLTADMRALYTQRPLMITSYDTVGSSAPHVREMIRMQLEERYGRTMLYTGGLVIKTTIKQSMQQKAVETFKAHVARLRTEKHLPFDGGLITLDVATGAIKALVGGYDFRTSQFNRAVQARRQLGSVFKPLMYASAVERGISLAECVLDEPIAIPDHDRVWEPSNVTHRFDGSMTLARALVTSNNIIAIKVLLGLGTTLMVEKARQAGITAPMNPVPSLALGCIDGTLMEAAGMFNIFAHQGHYVEPYLVSWIKDGTGKKIWNNTSVTRSVFSWATTSKVVHLLEQAVTRWKSYPGMPPLSSPAMGKTGTANDIRSCWFLGSTPAYTTAVYLGADDNRPLSGSLSIRTAFPLWLAYNQAIAQPGTAFAYDPQLTPICIHSITGEQVSSCTNETLTILVKHAEARA